MKKITLFGTRCVEAANFLRKRKPFEEISRKWKRTRKTKSMIFGGAGSGSIKKLTASTFLFGMHKLQKYTFLQEHFFKNPSAKAYFAQNLRINEEQCQLMKKII